jgi:hypothetical protein
MPNYENRCRVLSRLGNEMAPFVVGPISADAFLNYFLPPPPPPPDSPPFVKNMFEPIVDLVSNKKPEKEFYDKFVSSRFLLSRAPY